MKYVTIKMPRKYIDEARAAINKAHSENGAEYEALKRYELQRGDEEKTVFVNGEFKSVAETKRSITKDLAEKINNNMQPYREQIRTARDNFLKEYKQAITPQGHMIRGDYEGDFTLLSNGLISTEQELNDLMRRNLENPAVLRMVNAYAMQKGWKDSAVDFRRAQVEDFAEHFFKMAEAALENPNGYNRLFLGSDDAVRGMCDGYGVMNEYNMGGGEAYAAITNLSGETV